MTRLKLTANIDVDWKVMSKFPEDTHLWENCQAHKPYLPLTVSLETTGKGPMGWRIPCEPFPNYWTSVRGSYRQRGPIVGNLGVFLNCSLRINNHIFVDNQKKKKKIKYRADSRSVPSLWETVLLCNDICHWLGASLESALKYLSMVSIPRRLSHLNVKIALA